MVVTQTNSFSKILDIVYRPKFAQDHKSGPRSDRDPIVLCDFSKLQFWKLPYNFLNLYGRFCPYNPPYKTGGKSALTFFSKMRTFFKNRPPWYHPKLRYKSYYVARFFKNVLIFEEKGGTDDFENDPPLNFISKDTVPS